MAYLYCTSNTFLCVELVLFRLLNQFIVLLLWGLSLFLRFLLWGWRTHWGPQKAPVRREYRDDKTLIKSTGWGAGPTVNSKSLQMLSLHCSTGLYAGHYSTGVIPSSLFSISFSSFFSSETTGSTLFSPSLTPSFSGSGRLLSACTRVHTCQHWVFVCIGLGYRQKTESFKRTEQRGWQSRL